MQPQQLPNHRKPPAKQPSYRLSDSARCAPAELGDAGAALDEVPSHDSNLVLKALCALTHAYDVRDYQRYRQLLSACRGSLCLGFVADCAERLIDRSYERSR